MNIRLALRLLWRDWRAGELTLLLAALVIAVGTVTTITLFVDRLQQALLLESSSFLAADKVISTDQPLPSVILEKARELGLQHAETLQFVSMVFAEERAQFTAVKAVDDHYPLRGTLITSLTPFTGGAVATGGPDRGTVWMDSRLFPALDIEPGTALEIGEAMLDADKVLIKEPDRGGGFSNAAPRVMMHLDDVEGTEVVQPGSRITYQYLFAGDSRVIAVFEEWVRPQLRQGERIYGVREGAEGIGNALERAERFLLLGSLLGVVLAGVAIALAAQRYAHRHFDHVAILKTLGATPAAVDSIFIQIFVVLGVLATILGALVGYATQSGIAAILSPYIPVELPAAGPRPVILGLVTGFVCLLSYALPPLLRLRNSQPVRVIRRDLDVQPVSQTLSYVVAVVGTIGLMVWYSGDVRLTAMVFSGAVAAIAVLGIAAYFLLRSGRLIGMQAGSAWRLALAGMQKRGRENALHIMVFAIAIMLLLMLYLVRTALIDEWRAQLPEDAPNHFALNIAPDDVSSIEQMFTENNVRAQPLFSMVRGRIQMVNGESARERDRSLRGEGGPRRGPRSTSQRNLTWARDLPDDNVVIEGEWWSSNHVGDAEVSLESDFAWNNGLSVGDELIFNIEDRELPVTVSNIRRVAWDNMQPNFYIIFSPGSLAEFPSTYMTSFYLHGDQKLLLNDLLRAHPTMSVLEVDALIEQIQNIIEQVTLAIELVLLLIMISGALVLLASIEASMDERFKQHGILRTLGASRRLVMGSLVIEFAALGLFAGLLATLGSEISVFMLETQVFELGYQPNMTLWLLGPIVGTLLIGIVGTLATRKVVSTPPSTVLRELG